ncbi:hypothetical protein BU25DRAFT_274351 [Macroventuria anomochaeta]|uniref:Uncharacterized protein n=1 Tax=Macroventuria anomochaeta TaxID=301207 RepID=A0ACB6S698_9PLEO|nr:uncharacterized protein BU25DRAFT_274351 [Macroventuria anomochaeta]KAF2629796.1 hypothetical protein BU25DRAFT_274351 [Macroventuria anomochaeta]
MATDAIPGSLDEDIYLGFWINRSFDSVRGATLTLDRNRGGLLIAFLALFVSTSGRSLWKITRCVLHFVYSSDRHSEGVYHQRQAILRNTPLALDAAVELILAFRAWHRRGTSLFRKLLLPTLLALTLAVSFIFAGIFSSRVSNSSANEILLVGRDCNEDLPKMDDRESQQYITPFLNRKAAENLAYASQCYQTGDADRPDSCKVMTTPALPYKFDGNASCPFAADMCKQPFGNMVLDTGTLDSYTHFGLNTGPHVTVQVKEHCAPLVTNGFSNSSVDPDRSFVNFTRYYYGGGWYNYTFEIANNATSHTSDSTGDYEVYPEDHVYLDAPFIPQLQVATARTSLYFLVPSGVAYMNRTDDPWFSATTTSDRAGTWYIPDEPAAVLGCVSERTFCNPELPAPEGCLDLYVSGEASFRRVFPNPQDRMSLRPLSIVLQTYGAGGMQSFFTARSVPTLLARQTLFPYNPRYNYTAIQTKVLPSNQWQKEMEYVGQATLAAMQHSIVDYARGSWLGGGTLCEGEPCRRTCYSQKARSSKHYSFSVLGVGIILVVGGFLMLAAMLLEPIFAGLFKLPWFQRNHKLRYAYAEWQTGSTLQLQRLAHESLGVGTWSNTTGTVPVTRSEEKLATLDISDPTHARLMRPSVELAKVDYTNESMQYRPSLRYEKVPGTEQI